MGIERKKSQGPNGSQEQRRIQMTAPWGRDSDSPTFQSIAADDWDPETDRAFIQERSQVHALYIEQNEKTKRTGMYLACGAILVALLIMVFAPEGRETISYYIGIPLIIFSAGALGYGRVWGKVKGVSFGADQDRRDL